LWVAGGRNRKDAFRPVVITLAGPGAPRRGRPGSDPAEAGGDGLAWPFPASI